MSEALYPVGFTPYNTLQSRWFRTLGFCLFWNKFNSDPFEPELNCSKAKTVKTSKQSLTNLIWVIDFGC